MNSLEKSKGDKQNEENTRGENFGPSRKTEISESDDHEDDNTENEGPSPSRQTSTSCTDRKRDSPSKRKIESSSLNLEKKIERSRIETVASRIDKDAIVNKQFPCKCCEDKFSSMRVLRIHSVRKHNEYIPHTCKTCNRQFNSSSTLIHHVDRHHKKEMKHVCKICDKKFNMKLDLTRHLTIHYNLRNFVCDFCSKTFKNIQYCNKHMKTHTHKEEDKYECNVCGKRFWQKQNLKKHKQKEHSEEDSPTNEQRGQSLEEIDAQLTVSLDESTMTFRQEQDLQLQKSVDLKRQKNDSQESKRDMLNEISEHDNDPEMQNFIPHYYHNQNEIIEREQDSQSDNDLKFEHPDNQFILYDSYSQKESNSPKRIEHSEENIPLTQQDESVGIEMDLERQINEESRQNKSQYDETEPELYNQPCEDGYQYGKPNSRNPDFNDLKTLYEEQDVLFGQFQNVRGSRMKIYAQPSTIGMKIDKCHMCQICDSQFAQEQDLQDNIGAALGRQ